MRVSSNSCAQLALAIFLFAISASVQAKDVIKRGKTVTLEYTVTQDDGTVVDSSADGGPLTYVHGRDELLPALEAALAGLTVDDHKLIRLEPENAYGSFDPTAFREIPIDDVPESARRVGAQLRFKDSDEIGRVQEVREATVVIDYNHPLAGKTLTFDVRVLDID